MKKAARKSQLVSKTPSRPLLIVLSGPSGVGKDAVLTRMKESGYPLKFVITVTTRPQRANEKKDVDYHFVSDETFREMIEGNKLLESANVYGNWYGVPREEVEQALNQGQDVMVKVDIQGAATIKRIHPQAVTVFLMPPSIEELIARLEQRQTESRYDRDLRIKTAEEEMKQQPHFDYAVVNRWGEIDRAVLDIKAIITAEKLRLTPREYNL